MSTRKRLSTSERRLVILDAARKAFRDHDYPDASVPDIAAASGSSQALVFHYFSSKAGLHAALVQDATTRLAAAHRQAIESLPDGSSTRDRIQALLLAHLDAIAANPSLVAGPGEPPITREVRDEARAEFVALLRAMLGIGDFARHEWALWGWVGFLDRVARRWQESGCPEDQRWPLIDATLGALEGALGDWQVNGQ
ncbi:TetR/AcrR family transcriptional regulator [Corynebacterium atrinae]|uniref:TetR/AcrR family transcriptional regulator n=1 Tax=Corynebacterium atrinae TaxID=1336740 RepID=UPI0025B4C275|nr:TetR/AcrR family transcriptional regulator [Corynebacterium atrinae]